MIDFIRGKVAAFGTDWIIVDNNGIGYRMNGGLLRKAESALSLWKAKGRCRQLLQKERPDICVGFGNYISVPLILAAHDQLLQ